MDAKYKNEAKISRTWELMLMIGFTHGRCHVIDHHIQSLVWSTSHQLTWRKPGFTIILAASHKGVMD